MKLSKKQFAENLLKMAQHRNALMYIPQEEKDDYWDKIKHRDNMSLLYEEPNENSKND